MKKKLSVFSFLIVSLIMGSCSNMTDYSETLLDENFSAYSDGPVSLPVGAHTEYHYIKPLNPEGQWKITSFYFNPRGADTAWSIRPDNGKRRFFQSVRNNQKHTHPMIAAGDPLWSDYCFSAVMKPLDTLSRKGIIFRSRNDRQYYFFGMDDGGIKLLAVNHEKAFHTPDEKALASVSFKWEAGKDYDLKAILKSDRIRVFIDEKLVADVKDTLFKQGKVALMADSPTWFSGLRVTAPRSEVSRVAAMNEKLRNAEKELQAANPRAVVWKKISTPLFGMGRNLRFGDLDNDGVTDILIGQVVHHAYPRDSFSELSCLTAITVDGKILWQTGTPSPEHQELTNDVAFQIIDIDGDGNTEVIYTMNNEIVIAEGATGKVKRKAGTPAKVQIQYDDREPKKIIRQWDRILGDCLFICDLRGSGHPHDILIKDRYSTFWILDENLNVRWSDNCRTGHYPYARDINNDGKEELFIGYSAYSYDGKRLWTLDDTLKDHCDGIGVVDFREGQGSVPRIFIASSDQGAVLASTEGRILKTHLVGHVQNPAVANFRDDLPGLETVSINFWGNQGIIHFYDSGLNIYNDFEPVNYGSMCLPVNWNGSGAEFFVLSANVNEGGMFDGWGRKAVVFPDDGHPEMCNAVLDLYGDVRDEVVVWDTESIWIYTQEDSPRTGRLYKPMRNPIYNYSNYQLTVSEEGWNE